MYNNVRSQRMQDKQAFPSFTSKIWSLFLRRGSKYKKDKTNSEMERYSSQRVLLASHHGARTLSPVLKLQQVHQTGSVLAHNKNHCNLVFGLQLFRGGNQLSQHYQRIAAPTVKHGGGGVIRGARLRAGDKDTFIDMIINPYRLVKYS